MTVNKLQLCLTCLLIALLTAAPALALTPGQVVVVANARSKDSIELAKYYTTVRGIPAEHIVEINAPVQATISRELYQTNVLRPVREALSERDLRNKIHCLCFMWGVPVTVAGPKETKLLSAYHTAAERAHYRLAIDYKLIPSVGRKFPEPRTNGLAPVGKLFAAPLPEPREPLMAVGKLVGDLDRLLARKQKEVARIEDPRERAVATRQLMALHLDRGGLQGLLQYIRSTGVEDAPPPEALEQQLIELRDELNELSEQPETAETVRRQLEIMDRALGAGTTASYASQKVAQLEPAPESSAALDSEMALLWWGPYPLKKMIGNPLNWKQFEQIRRSGRKVSPVLMTARIDGPTPEDARRIIRLSVQTEEEGLRGTFYIDADQQEPRSPEFDNLFLDLHRLVDTRTSFPVVLNTEHELFQPGEAPNAALYTGWYKLQHYVPAFTWAPGAVGYHVASAEAKHLRDPDSIEWCVKMIQNGVVATVGAVEEPYLGAFPAPNEFFPLLLTGKLTVAECYWRTTTTTSWRLTLIADPLYNPFRANPQLRPEDVPPGVLPPLRPSTAPSGGASDAE